MNVLQKYLDENNISKYKIAQLTGISSMTLSHATEKTKPLSGQTVKVLSAVAKSLNKTPGTVLDELVEIQNAINK